MRRPALPMFRVVAAAACLAPALAAAGAGAIPALSLQADFGAVSYRVAGFGQGLRAGAGILVRTGRRAAVEIMLERFSVGVAAGAGSEERLAAGRMKMTELLFQQHFRFLLRGRVHPFASVGLGFCFIGHDPDPARAGPKIDFVDRLALQLGGGVEYFLAPRASVCAGARYNMVRTWVEELPRTLPIRRTNALAENVMHLYGLELSLAMRFAVLP